MAIAPTWRIRLGRGMACDVRRRLPFYASDWRDAWDYRVVPATVYMYFANILPALAFSLDMFTKTGMQYGVNEVLLSSVLGAVVFSLCACQPLVIVGVTGPITVFNYTVYDIIAPRGTNFLAFMCWIGLWSLVFHWMLALGNACNALRYVTRFPCDIFGLYVAFIYLQKGIQVLTRLGDAEPFYLSIFVAVASCAVAYLCSVVGRGTLFAHPVRVFLKDYGTPLTVVFFSGFVHIGRMRRVTLDVLPTGIAFEPTNSDDRIHWLVAFWRVDVGDVFLAIPFALILTVLFYFDHNVSSLIAQGTEFPLRKPSGFHWDLFLLGITTGVAGLLGLPFPNGLIPQAPFHTESLCVTELVKGEDEDGSTDMPSSAANDANDPFKGHPGTHIATAHARVTHVVEQRVSNLAQGLLTLGTMTGPLLYVLHLIPQAVLAGLFFVMGIQVLESNGVTTKLLFLLRDASLTPRSHPLHQLIAPVRVGRRENIRGLRFYRHCTVWAFVALELVGLAITFAITQTVAAVGFPICILLLIPVRIWLLPRIFSAESLAILDASTASPFTMESVIGSGGGGGGGGGGSRMGDDANDDGARSEGLRRRPGVPTTPKAAIAATSASGPSQHDQGLFPAAQVSHHIGAKMLSIGGEDDLDTAVPSGTQSDEHLAEMGLIRHRHDKDGIDDNGDSGNGLRNKMPAVAVGIEMHSVAPDRAGIYNRFRAHAATSHRDSGGAGNSRRLSH